MYYSYRIMLIIKFSNRLCFVNSVFIYLKNLQHTVSDKFLKCIEIEAHREDAYDI